MSLIDATLWILSRTSWRVGSIPSRLYQRLVYYIHRAEREGLAEFSHALSLISKLRSAFPGHTIEEVKKWIDKRSLGCSAEAPSDHELQAPRPTIEGVFLTRNERGFGGFRPEVPIS